MPDETLAPKVEARDLGLMEYGVCWEVQQELHAAIVLGKQRSTILAVEHPPVLTLGKHAVSGNMLRTDDDYRKHGIGVYRIDRGGEVTAHEPGQLVIYPVLKLADFGLAPKSYVSLLENAVIALLAEFGVNAATDPQHPGVWVGMNKICAVGIRIKERVSMHGIALNVCNDMRLFHLIVPCGIKGRGVTSLSRLLGRDVGTEDVKTRLVEIIAKSLHYRPDVGA